jgi:cytosine/adenosine deaminase-related metal-dependent hydrolase
MARTRIRNATILSVDPNVGDFQRGDLLIEGSKIAATAPSIQADDAEIVDATNRITIPGFVDTHRHAEAAASEPVESAYREPLRATAQTDGERAA